MNRDQFLDRVRGAAASGRMYRVHPHAHAHGKYAPENAAQAQERFGREVAAAGGVFHVAPQVADLNELIRTLVEQHPCHEALVWRHPVLERFGVYQQLDALGVEWLDADRAEQLAPSARRAAWLSATLGITAADFAIAETGSVVVQSARGRERMTSLLPTVHLAIVEASALVPDLFDLFAQLPPQTAAGMPSNLTLITGPSKTGDLELRLVTGVHGPRHWHVALMDA